MRKFTFILLSACLCCALITGCATDEESATVATSNPYTGAVAISPPDLGTSSDITSSVPQSAFSFTQGDQDASYEAADATKIKFGNTISVQGAGASVSENLVTISAAGTYILSGSTPDGRILIAADKDDKVHLVLNGIDLTCADYSPIYIEQAYKVFLTLADGTQNKIADGATYAPSGSDGSADAAIFSKADLTINGSGSLNVNGNYKHGIVSKDDLVITGGTLSITAVNVGLSGKDCVKIADGAISITSGTDGIRSDNSADEQQGYIYIANGSFTVNAGCDGFQAETELRIDGGNFTITTGSGSANASTQDGWGNWGGGRNGETAMSTDTNSDTGIEEDNASAKALKAGLEIYIAQGVFDIDSSDDAIHTSGSVKIENGVITLSSGDDGIHADSALIISGGEIRIEKSYEGLEAARIKITDGTIYITAGDDGINASGGNDGSAMGGRPGQDTFAAQTGVEICIAGGYLEVDASGDGLDSNGNLYVKGGIVLVSGPENNGNGTLDYNDTGSVTGGMVIAAGSIGMAENFGSTSSQCSILYAFSSPQKAGTRLTLCDEDGTVLLSWAPGKTFQTAVFSTPGLISGSSYQILLGGTVEGTDECGFVSSGTLKNGSAVDTIQLTSTIYSNAAASGQGGSMGSKTKFGGS